MDKAILKFFWIGHLKVFGVSIKDFVNERLFFFMTPKGFLGGPRPSQASQDLLMAPWFLRNPLAQTLSKALAKALAAKALARALANAWPKAWPRPWPRPSPRQWPKLWLGPWPRP